MTRLLSLLEMERAARPRASDRSCVRSVAARVIDELGLTEPPVDVDMVASALDIHSVTRDPNLTVAGCLIPGASGGMIRVRAFDSQPRQRFTVCHECGHTFFPGYALLPQYRCAPQPGNVEARDLETLCDIAASELLLPPRLLRPALTDTGLSLDAIENLADLFDASLVATALAAIRHAGFPAALLTFRLRQKPSEVGTTAVPVLRLQNFITEGEWPFLRRYKSAAPHDVFDRASQGEIVSERSVTVNGICNPITCDVEAKLYPYLADGMCHHRVLALLTRPRAT